MFTVNELRHEKTCFSHMPKQRQRPAVRLPDQRLCFDYIDSTIPLLPKSEISSLCCIARFVTDLVTNPVDWFSHDAAQIMVIEIAMNLPLASATINIILICASS